MKKGRKRGTSSATKKAKKFFEENTKLFDDTNPDGMTASELAEKFEIHAATVMRQPWWKNRYEYIMEQPWWQERYNKKEQA